MIRTVVSLSALLALMTVVAPVAGQDQEVFQKLREFSKIGKTSFEDKNFDKAAEAFQSFLNLLPKERSYNETRAHAHYYLACSYAHLEKRDEVFKNLESAFGNLDNHGQLEELLAFSRDDSDLTAVRGEARFKLIVSKYEKLASEKLQKFDFALKTVDGKPIAKKDYVGKVLVVAVWGTWCGPCRKEIPSFIKLQKTYEKEGLQIVGLNSERGLNQQQKTSTVKQAIQNFKINYPCALATDEILMSVNVQAFPTTLFVGRDGRVRKMVKGYKRYEDLEKIVKPLLAEAPPKPKDAKKEAGKKDDAKKETS